MYLKKKITNFNNKKGKNHQNISKNKNNKIGKKLMMVI